MYQYVQRHPSGCTIANQVAVQSWHKWLYKNAKDAVWSGYSLFASMTSIL